MKPVTSKVGAGKARSSVDSLPLCNQSASYSIAVKVTVFYLQTNLTIITYKSVESNNGKWIMSNKTRGTVLLIGCIVNFLMAVLLIAPKQIDMVDQIRSPFDKKHSNSKFNKARTKANTRREESGGY